MPTIPEPQTYAGLKPENASVFDPAWKAPLRTLVSLLGLDDPTQIMNMGMAMPVGSMEGGALDALSKRFPRLAGVIKAYHGSPHDFEKFDVSKIGTGEGAQAYGHGMYFAENPGVAQSYRDTLGTITSSPEYQIHAQAQKAVTDATLEHFTAPTPETAQVLKVAQQHARETEQRLLQAPKGRMYEVAINAHPDQFLDWDKPLSQQSEQVQASAKKLIGNVQPVKVRDGWYSVTRVSPDGSGSILSSDVMESSPEAAMKAFNRWVMEDKGSNFYHLVGNESRGPLAQSGPAVASAKLKDAGIPGIKYLDQGSRAAGEGSRNYVVFDDKTIEILRKYGLFLPAAGAAQQMTSQQETK